MRNDISLVILCGGKGTRLGKITQKIPKPLIRINKKPFIEYLINFYQRFNFNKIYLLGYHKHSQFEKLYQGKEFNFIKCEFIKEDKPLDTAGALNTIRDKVKGDMIVINGDSYLDYNFKEFDNFNIKNKSHSMILVKNINYQSNNKLNKLRIEKKFIKKSNNSKYMNSGIYFFRKEIFNFIPKNKRTSLENDILPYLIKNKKIKGIYSKDFFIDIGLKENLNFAKKKLIQIIKKPAIFLDRDGVINQDTGYAYDFNKIIWLKDTLKFLKNLDHKKLFFFIVTNQSGIGRKIYSEKDFLNLHKDIKKYLIKKNIFIDEVKYCPHHPEFGIGKYKKKCKCRKPNNKMIIDLKKYWNIKIKDSIMIGDKKTDYIAAKKSNIKFYYINDKNLFRLRKYN